MMRELLCFVWEAFCYFLRIWWDRFKEGFFNLFRSRRAKILRELRNICGVCEHPKKAHTWLYGSRQGQVQDCGWVTKPGDGIFTDSEKICWCPKFTELNTLDICERLEERLKNDV